MFRYLGKVRSSKTHLKLMSSQTSQEKTDLVEQTDFNFNHTIKCSSGDVHAIWLRHHCRCEKCYNHRTHQRVTIPSQLPKVSTVIDSTEANEELVVSWTDGHVSKYDMKWLREYAPNRRLKSYYPKQFAERSQSLVEAFKNLHKQPASPFETAIMYDDFMKDGSSGVAHLISSILKYGYGIINNCPVSFEETKSVIKRVSHPQNTIYGDFSEWTSNLAYADTAYTSDIVHLHTDTSYFTEPIGLQIFHCLKHDGTGGVNSIADGFQIAQNIAQKRSDIYEILSSINIPSQYIDNEGQHHFYSNDVTFAHDQLSGHIQKIRYNPHDMAVLKRLPFEDVAKFYEGLIYFSDSLENEFQEIKLTPGLIIFLDNWRVLHGRTAFTGFRHLCGAYISRSDWLSRARTLGLLQELD